MKKSLPLLLALSLLAACSNRPSEAEVQRQVSERTLGGNRGLFVIESFKKLNGFEASPNVYSVDVEYDLVFQKSLADLALNLGKRDDPVLAGLDLVALGLRYGQFQAGDRQHRTEKVTFQHTERGWLLQNDR